MSTNVEMQRYRLPGYEMQLVGELQRQQTSALFCDTLLQSDGISVPTHSCILAAFSPYLSRKLSTSPSPPSGQKRQLQLQTVKAKTLLKLVGLLYSGELEVKGSVEQNDVLAAARQFEITDLVEGQTEAVMMEGGCKDKHQSFSCSDGSILVEEGVEGGESRKIDAQVQTGTVGSTEIEGPVKKRSSVSKDMQSWVETMDRSVLCCPSPESAPSVSQSLDISMSSQPNITAAEHLISTTSPPILSIPEAPSDVHSESSKAAAESSETNPTSTVDLSSNMTASPISPRDDSSSQRTREDGTHQQSSVIGNNTQVLAGCRIFEHSMTDGTQAEYGDKAEQQSQTSREEMQGGEKGKSKMKSNASDKLGTRSLAKTKQMMETTQISVKVKLRRTPKGKVWEVVRLQDTDERLSALTSLNKDASKFKRPRRCLTNMQLLSSISQPSQIHIPEIIAFKHGSTDSQTPSGDHCTPNQNGDPQSAPLVQPHSPIEDSDEQIAKILEDIMMGLNILPTVSLEGNCNKSLHRQPSQDGASDICQDPVTEGEAGQGQMHATATAEDCVCYHDYDTGGGSTSTVLHSLSTSDLVTPASTTCTVSIEHDCDISAQSKSPQCCTPSGHTSSIQNLQLNPNNLNFCNSTWIDACPPTCYSRIHYCSRAQNQPSYSSTPSVQLDTVPLSKPQSCLYPKAPTTRPYTPIASYSSGKRLHYPAVQESSSHEEQGILEISSQSQGNEALTLPSLPFMDDWCFPRCLSPLEAHTSGEKDQPVANNSINHEATIHPEPPILKPPIQRPPWLMEHPVSLQFPLSSTTLGENNCESSSLYKNSCCQVKQSQEHLEVNLKTGASCTESCPGNWVRTQRSNSLCSEIVTEFKSYFKKVKENVELKCKQVNAVSDAVEPTRRKRQCSNLRYATDPLLAYKDLKVSDTRKSAFSLSVCSVSLLSNNVLAKEREMAVRSVNEASKCAGNPNSLSVVTESQRENVRGRTKLVNAEQVRIRTRGFLKIQETASDASSYIPSVTKPSSSRVKMLGRPRRIKFEEVILAEEAPPIIENKSYNEHEQQIDGELQEKKEKPKSVRRKRMRKIIKEVEVVPRKRAASAESTDKAEANDRDITHTVNNPGKPKLTRMVTLKEFQNRIEHKHLETGKSKEKQVKKSFIEPVTNVPDEGKTCDITDSIREKLTNNKTRLDMDITDTQDCDGMEASHGTCDASVGKNLNQIFNKSTDRSLQKEEQNSGKKLGSSDENHVASRFVGLEEQMSNLAVAGGLEKEEQPTNHDEVLPCSRGVSDKTQSAGSDEGFSRSDCPLPQEEIIFSGDSSIPQAHRSTDSLPLEVSKISKSSGCDQEDEEEVDVLIYSPCKSIQTRESEDANNNIEISPDEEEEEDVNVTDVTDDEV